MTAEQGWSDPRVVYGTEPAMFSDEWFDKNLVPGEIRCLFDTPKKKSTTVTNGAVAPVVVSISIAVVLTLIALAVGMYVGIKMAHRNDGPVPIPPAVNPISFYV